MGTTEEVFWAARRLLEVTARERPLVVVFDDVHWAEPTFLDLVEHVAEWSRDAAILLICLARPELIEERPSWGSGRVKARRVQLLVRRVRTTDPRPFELLRELAGAALAVRCGR